MKKTLTFLLILSMLVTLFPMASQQVIANSTTEKSADSTKDIIVRVHYHRFDDVYDGWNAWLWPEGGDGKAYTFDSQDDFGVLLETTIPQSASVDKVGLIIRLNEWEAKDIDVDRFLDVAQMNDEGILDVFLIQGDEKIYYDANDIDLSPKILGAELIDTNKVSVIVSTAFELASAQNLFKITQSDGTVIKILEITSKQKKELVTTAIITLDQPLSIGNQYTIEGKNYTKFPINLSKAFDFPTFNETFYYDGNDLGVTYAKAQSQFRLWSPVSQKAEVLLYSQGKGGELVSSTPMTKDVNGTFVASIDGDLAGKYYTYQVTYNGTQYEAVDPYAKAVGINGDRGAIVDLSLTNPNAWDVDSRPEFLSFNDAIIYELHIRDLSMSDTSGITNKGKYLGLTETGTTNAEGLSTGIDHLKELGITHVQLLPVFDYRSIDESTLEKNAFNWGYDPENYNAPEGSYSTDPSDSSTRIKEFKTMVQSLHNEGIRVVMDVVYNHTGASADSHFNTLVPDYYYRTVDGKLSNGSGCGNETASERAMVRKMIVDSVVYWVTEYHIDGFRFDLMGLHDIETMNEVRSALTAIDPSIIVYGEGWTGGSCPLSESLRVVKANVSKTPGIGVFSDDLRDGIKGSVFEDKSAGFVNGALGLEDSIKFGIVGSTLHDQVNYIKVNYSVKPWALTADQSINYAEAHDNKTLWDKLAVTNANDSIEDRIAMDQMSAAIFLTSQGIPFIHAGMEFLRSKGGDGNSYQSPDSVNSIDWSLKSTNKAVFDYYQGLIQLRKAHPAFRMNLATDINEHLSFYGMEESYGALQLPEKRMVGYIINDHANNDAAGAIGVLFNANKESQTVLLPDGEWTIVVNKNQVNIDGIEQLEGNQVIMQPLETIILVSKDPVDLTKVSKAIVTEVEETSEKDTSTQDTTSTETEETSTKDKKNSWPILLGTVILGIVGISGVYLFRKNKKANK